MAEIICCGKNRIKIFDCDAYVPNRNQRANNKIKIYIGAFVISDHDFNNVSNSPVTIYDAFIIKYLSE